MNRSGGLIQRKNAAASGSAHAGSDAAASGEDGADQAGRRDEKDEEDMDDKQTRLTLMEEVLLLGLKDTEVVYKYGTILIPLILIANLKMGRCKIGLGTWSCVSLLF